LAKLNIGKVLVGDEVLVKGVYGYSQNVNDVLILMGSDQNTALQKLLLVQEDEESRAERC